MIKLFPKSKAYIVLLEAIVFLIGAALYYDGKPIYWSLILWSALGLCAYVAVSAYAVRLNTKLLSILMIHMMPEEFLKYYLPLLKTPGIKRNIIFQMKNYVVMAHVAAGNFQKAMDTLDSMEILSGRVESQCRGVIASARCGIYLYQNMLSHAKNEYEILENLGEASKISNDVREALRIRISIEEKNTVEKDVDFLREYMKKSSFPLTKNEIRFWIAQGYGLIAEEGYACSYYEEVSKCPKELYITKQAKKKITEFKKIQ